MILAAYILVMPAAAELPSEPAPTVEIPGECANAYPLQEGDSFPVGLVDGSVVSCSGVVVPTSRLGSLMLWEEHAKLVRKLYVVDMATMQDEIDTANAKISNLEQPVPWFERPSTQRWIGVAAGVVLGSAATVIATQWPEQ